MPVEETKANPDDLETAVKISVDKWQCQRASLINQEDEITSQGDAPVQENLGCDDTTVEQTNKPVRRSMRNRNTLKQRSRSCSEITSLQPEIQNRCVKTIIEEDTDIDGNELVEMLKSKLTMRSPTPGFQSPTPEKTVFPESSPSKSIFTPTKSKSNINHHNDSFSCHLHSDSEIISEHDHSNSFFT